MAEREPALHLSAVPGIPAIEAGDDLATILAEALDAADMRLENRDVLVITSKLLSKAEGRIVDLAEVTASARARELAEQTGKDPALVEIILSESREVLRWRAGLIISEHRSGVVMANAGVDQSNVARDEQQSMVLLLPQDSDASSAAIRARLGKRYGVDIAVVVSDSVGRAWRQGVVGIALGAAGLPALVDLRGKRDRYGRPLMVTQVGFADAIASAAGLLMGEADEGRPVILVRGLDWSDLPQTAASLVRPRRDDLFR